MAKEEEQVFPLLINNCSIEDQSSLVWQYLCEIPTYLLVKVLSHMSTSLSTCEYQDLLECLRTIVPKEKLLQEVIFNWIEGKEFHEPHSESTSLIESVAYESRRIVSHPIDDTLLWHKAIKKELNEIFEKIKRMYLSGDFTSRQYFDERLKFIVGICLFHSSSRDKVIFPSVYGEALPFHQHAEQKSIFNMFQNWIQNTKEELKSSAEFYSKLCSIIDQIMGTINRHLYIEESQVLPLAREKFSIERQRVLLHQCLCTMPLRLIQRVLPWLVGTMNEKEAKNFTNNLRLAGPTSDSSLVKLFCCWACNAGDRGLCESSSGKYCNHINSEDFGRPSTLESVSRNPSNVFNGQRLQLNHHSCSAGEYPTGFIEQPIDIIFKVHKAIRRDLEYLSVESGRIRDGDEAFLHQFIGRFCLLWGLYKSHSNSKDNIIYPAIESKVAFRNVTHSYTLDHEQEERLYEEIYRLLSALSQLPQKLSTSHDPECNSEYHEISTKLQVMCKSIRVAIDQHTFREEHELWPLLRSHFSVEEQEKIIGYVLGTTTAEVLRLLLPWVTSSLTEEDQNKMMDILKRVTKNTMFEEWLSDCSKANSFSVSHRVFESGPFQENMVRTVQILRPRKNDRKDVHLGSTSCPTKRKKLLQKYMARRWMAAQKRLPRAREKLIGRSASFRDPEEKVFGCDHYKRNCKLRATCCGELFTCRFCHDSVSDHSMDRKATVEMMCMQCLEIQPIGLICNTPSCNGFPMAKYYCNICKIFDDERRNIYHCPYCNICRIGFGLGFDYFHCMSCNCCMAIKLLDHKCKQNCLETSCLVCDEFLFTSIKPVKALRCGQCIHSTCFKSVAKSSVMVVGDYGKMRPYNHIENEQQMEVPSWTGNTSKKRVVFGFARFWAERLYPFLLWLGNSLFNHGRVWTIRKEIKNVVEEGNRTEDSLIVCCFVLCSVVVFCVMSSLAVLLCLKVVEADKYILPW